MLLGGIQAWPAERDRDGYRKREEADERERDLRGLAPEAERLVREEEHGEDDGDGGEEDHQLASLVSA